MELLKEDKGHKIFKKRSGKYAVQDGDGKWVNGADKVKILNAAGVIKVNPPKPKEAPVEAAAEAPVEEAPAEEPAAEEEAPAEEPAAE